MLQRLRPYAYESNSLYSEVRLGEYLSMGIALGATTYVYVDFIHLSLRLGYLLYTFSS